MGVVYVLNRHGKPLMPCHPAKARMLLKQGKAKVVRRTPFTIRLLYGSSGYKQPVTLGIDSGYKSIGVSAVTESRELYTAEVELRNDIVQLISERRQYRRTRRYRKTWYRKPRFHNRARPDGWLAPSIRNKLDSHVKLVRMINEILPVSSICVEVSAFDIQKIKNPDIDSSGYQQGEQYGFWNVREYVLYRDGHVCQHCKGRTGDKVLEVHHIVSRQTGGDRPDNLITLCRTCHRKVTAGEITLNLRPSRGFKSETFMSTIRWKLINLLRNIYPDVSITPTYGYITKARRIEKGLGKSHINDAFVIAGGERQERLSVGYFIKQVRKCNRKLFRGSRSHIRNTAERLVYGFQRYDKVLWHGIECFIFGRRRTGYFDLRKLDGTRVHASARWKDCSLLEGAKTFLMERRLWLLHSLTEGVSAIKV